MAYETHEFRCIACGNAGIPIVRSKGHLKKGEHRKKLYCMTCHREVNHIEIKNELEREKFLEDFKNGVYEDEAKEIVPDGRYTWCWKEHLD